VLGGVLTAVVKTRTEEVLLNWGKAYAVVQIHPFGKRVPDNFAEEKITHHKLFATKK